MAKQPYRILQIVSTLNRGGTETMIMNHYRKIDKSMMQFDFLVHGNIKGDYEDEILESGGKIFRAPLIRPWTYPKYFKWLDAFFKEHANDFHAVHGHIQENTGFALHFAKKHGIQRRIASSHVAPQKKDYKFIFRKFASFFLKKSLTGALACGTNAGKALFGDLPFEIFRNAINTDDFSFNPETRKHLRNQLNLSDNCFVIGHVGRFDYAKNQGFIIDCFNELYKKQNDAVLILIGNGSTFDSLSEKIKMMESKNNIFLLGKQTNINEWIQVFDLFIMPSIYEGLPVSVVEAQAAGLPCILSDTIDRECDITGNVKFLSLQTPLSEWCQEIINFQDFNRLDVRKKIIDNGYDVSENIKRLLTFYGISDL